MNWLFAYVIPVLIVLNGSAVWAQGRGAPGDDQSALSNPAPIVATTSNAAAESFADKAKEALYEADDETAVKMYDEAIKLDPKNAKYRYAKAVSLINLDRKAGALLELQVAVDLDPQMKDAYGHLGKLNYEMGDFRQCVVELTKGIAVDPQSAFNYYQRGQCSYELADVDAAQADFKKAVELDPSYMERLSQ